MHRVKIKNATKRMNTESRFTKMSLEDKRSVIEYNAQRIVDRVKVRCSLKAFMYLLLPLVPAAMLIAIILTNGNFTSFAIMIMVVILCRMIIPKGLVECNENLKNAIYMLSESEVCIEEATDAFKENNDRFYIFFKSGNELVVNSKLASKIIRYDEVMIISYNNKIVGVKNLEYID